MITPLISVIVPVYNCEKYLKACLDSLLAQIYKNLELILVDDGANAATKAILDTYAHAPGVTLFHKENGGSSDARNYGLQKATGDFITFLDADDLLHPEAYARCVQVLTRYPCDFLAFRHTTFFGDGAPVFQTLSREPETRYDSHENPYDHFMANAYFGGTVWNKLWRRNAIEGVTFTNNGCEDAVFVWDTLSHIHSFALLPDTMHYYRYVTDGLSKKPNVTRMMNCFRDFALLEQRAMETDTPSITGIRRNELHWALSAANSIVISGGSLPDEQEELTLAVARLMPLVKPPKAEVLAAKALLRSWRFFRIVSRFIGLSKKLYVCYRCKRRQA